jgi:tetratricopeptide (TPR) repeat protein
MKTILSLVIIAVLVPHIGNSQAAVEPQSYSLSGKPLYSVPPDPESLAKSDSIIRFIQSKHILLENDFIEIGKQLVATARYKEAVENYTLGLNQFPKSFKLLRLRGHRYLTLRKLDLVVIDLLKARELIKSQPDVWEVDGEGKKTDTYQHQIEYHLGVYYFLTKSYKKSVTAFEKSLAEAHDSKEIVGTTDWLYNAYQRNGQQKEAEKLLSTIASDYSTDHDQAYFRRVMLYKGVIKPNELVDEALPIEKMSIQDVTKLYGLANWYGFHGNKQKSKELYAKIIQSTSWPAFAFLASEMALMEK